MRSLEKVLSDMVGRTIVEVGTEDDELMIGLDDGIVLWIHVEEDELMMTVDSENAIHKQ
jgi:hypothetical protein